MKNVNIVVGRFQPFTNGHYKCAEYAMKQLNLPTVICMINVPDSKTDKRHPFPSDMLVSCYDKLFKNDKTIEDIVLVKSADIVTIGKLLHERDYQISSWTCGTDRFPQYDKMATKYHDQAMLSDDFKVLEVPRSDDDISATKARTCLINDEKQEFLNIIPDGVDKDSLYKILQEQLKKVYAKSEAIKKTLDKHISVISDRLSKLESILHKRRSAK